ncbi:hypothetical protein VitviT2T_029132 [Vitis vinifera]|uniref:Valencene synthase n=2 Tax=Vitis vinifera TaxID=29760 RepID=A0ABY9DX54_VITVI|nr:hypothetical protein VitviT2T_029132 [Vitis vinifera]
MPLRVSACSPAQNAKPVVNRPTADFSPSIWGERFISYTPADEIARAHKEKQVEDLKEKVRRRLITAAGNPSQQLNYIDAIQRLGVAYHFEREIEEALKHMYDNYYDVEHKDDDLYNVSLQFRLLRQQGFNLSCDVFNKFKDQKGGFQESLINDVRGMLGLYEATHIRERFEQTRGEVVYIYHKHEASHDKALLKLAKLDFNLMQSLHKEELSNLSRWHTELGFTVKISFARDRVVEVYFFVLAMYFEPQYSRARRILTKVLYIISTIDDMYDAYGSLEEHKLFAEMIERWDINSIDQLPEHMKVIYQALLDVYKEIEEEMDKEGKAYSFHHAKEAMKIQIGAYFDEAQWFHEGNVPTIDKYMQVARVSSSLPLTTVIFFIGMDEIITKEAFEWVYNDPFTIASCLIARLMNDMTSHKFEQERGHVASAIECYVKQYSVSKQQAYDEFNKQIANAWKDINQGFLRPTSMPVPILTGVLNLT